MDWVLKNYRSQWDKIITSSIKSDVKNFRIFRFVVHMKMNPKFINISLGPFDRVIEYSKKLKTTGFEDFHARGFLESDAWLKISESEKWIKYVAKAIKQSYDGGGKIYIHFDGAIKGFRGIHDKTDPFYLEGLALELRYLIDNGLVDKGRVKFFLGTDPLPTNLQALLDSAILQRKIDIATNPKKYNSQKGNHGYNY